MAPALADTPTNGASPPHSSGITSSAARPFLMLSGLASGLSILLTATTIGTPAAFACCTASWVCGITPDLTLLLDLPIDQGLARARGRGPADRIECETDGVFERVRGAYRRRAGEDAGRWRVIDASQPVDAVLAALDVALDAYFGGTA